MGMGSGSLLDPCISATFLSFLSILNTNTLSYLVLVISRDISYRDNREKLSIVKVICHLQTCQSLTHFTLVSIQEAVTAVN